MLAQTRDEEQIIDRVAKGKAELVCNVAFNHPAAW